MNLPWNRNWNLNWKMTPPDWPSIDAFLLANGWAIIGLLLLLAGAGLLLDYLRRSWRDRRRSARSLGRIRPHRDHDQGWP